MIEPDIRSQTQAKFQGVKNRITSSNLEASKAPSPNRTLFQTAQNNDCGIDHDDARAAKPERILIEKRKKA
jgi:hypothetical protein